MNKFQQLVHTLQTNLIILIDDDFTPVQDVQEILTYICFLNPLDRRLLMLRLESINRDLIEPLNQLFEGLNQIEILDADVEFIEAGLITDLLTNKGFAELREEINVIIRTIQELNLTDDIATLAMMYGLRLSASTETYNPFFDSLNEFGLDKSIRLYRGLVGEEFTRFEEEIRNVNQQRDNKFPLLIVDRQLADGQLGSEIIDNLREGDNQINRFFSVLYTSQEVEQIEPTDLQSYFHIQLRKDDTQALDKVSEALALSAFATFFDQIYKYRKESLDSANQLVIESGLINMLYLAGMAHAEGDTVFNVFNKWFDLLSDKKVQDKLLTNDPEGFDLNFMIGLTTLINSNFISSITGNGGLDVQFHQEIKELETYEIFSLNINKFCSPPTPGDLFEIDGQLYMLIGQECDLVVRSNGTTVNRNEKLAELVKCTFDRNQQDLKVDSSRINKLMVNHFEFENVKGVLEIDLSSNDFFDFRILDLCCLNKDGISRYYMSDFPSPSTLKLLPKKWRGYIPELIAGINDKIKVHDFITQEGIKSSSLSGDYSFSITYTKTEESITFPVKRIGRIKGQFREYVLQRYWQYKTRMGLNTIGLYQRVSVEIQRINAGFPYDLQEVNGVHNAWVQLTGNRDKNKDKSKLELILKKEHLVSAIDEKFKQAINDVDTNEVIIRNKKLKKNKIVFSKEWDEGNLSLKIEFPLFNEYANHFFVGRDGLTAYDLFGKELIDTNDNLKGALFSIGDDTNQLLPDNGHPYRIDLEKILTGKILIPGENIKLEFDREEGKLLNTGPINQEQNDEK